MEVHKSAQEVYTRRVPAPHPDSVNTGLSYLKPATCRKLLGEPRLNKDYTDDYQMTDNPAILSLLVRREVTGLGRVTGLKPAVDSLERIATRVRHEAPNLLSVLSSGGMFNCRRIRGTKDTPSNHCLPASQTVWTVEKGPVPIGELKDFDGHVWAYDNGVAVPARMTNFWENGEKPILRIKIRGHEIRCTDNHPILVMKKRTLEKDEWIYRAGEKGSQRALYWTQMVRADEIKPGDTVVCVKELPELRSPNEPNHDWAEVLGLFVGDGCVGHRDGKPEYVTFAIPAEDRIRQHSDTLLTKCFGKQPKRNDRFLTFYDPAIVSRFAECDKYARAKEVPAEVWSWSAEAQRRFLLGYLYSDGCVVSVRSHGSKSSTARFAFKAGSERLIHQVRMIATGLGFRTGKILYEAPQDRVICGVPTVSNGVWSFTAVDVHGAMEPEADPLYMERIRLSSAHKRGNTRCCGYEEVGPHFTHAKVESIEQEGTEPIFDITVEGLHNFITDGIVVSNSWGCAIDVMVAGRYDTPGDGMTFVALLDLYRFFHAEGWFWGTEFRHEDSMHFEVADETLRSWLGDHGLEAKMEEKAKATDDADAKAVKAKVAAPTATQKKVLKHIEGLDRAGLISFLETEGATFNRKSSTQALLNIATRKVLG